MPVPVRHRPFRRGWLIAAAAAAVLASVGAGAFLAGNIGHVSGSAQAIKTRQDILNALPALSVSGVPNGAQLVSKLATAMQDSITADKDYQGWMADFAGSGRPCGSDPSQDPSYGAGQNASGAATTAKSAFVAIWDPMAPRYRQQVYSSTGF
jgi:hypothetical protein